MALALTTLVLCRALAPLDLSLLVLLAYIAPIALGELVLLKVHRRPSSGLDFRKVDWNPARVYIKLLGFYATLAAVAFFYWLLPEFTQPTYAPFWSVIYGGWPLLVIPYFIAVDCVGDLREPVISVYRVTHDAAYPDSDVRQFKYVGTASP
jgi:hypothetical protein